MGSETTRRLARAGLLALLLLAGCYSFKGSLPPHLKSVAIPLMENETAEIGLAEEIGQLVIERFLSDGLLKVSSLEAADAVLHLTLKRIVESAADFDQGETVTRVKVTVSVAGRFEDLVEDRERWAKTFQEWGDFDPDTETRDDAIDEAVEKIVQSINAQLLSEW